MPSKEFLSRRGSVWERTSFEGKDLPTIRSEMEALALSDLKEYDDVTWGAGSAGEITGKWVYPKNPCSYLLYYIHGGGFTLGSSGIPMPFLLELSHRLSVTCFSADYRLAPENKFPNAPDDAFAAYKALIDLGYAPDHIIVCGESAGATLTLDVPLMAKASGVPNPLAVIAMSPVTDCSPKEEYGTVIEGLDSTDGVLADYAPGVDPLNPLISPAFGDLEGYPAALLIAGGDEFLAADSLIFTKKVAEAGGDIRLHIGKDMIHTYPLDFWDYPEAMTAFEEIELFIKQLIL